MTPFLVANNEAFQDRRDGRSDNKGEAKRQSYTYQEKAKEIYKYEDWSRAQLNDAGTVVGFVSAYQYPQKFIKFLGRGQGGWRAPETRSVILKAAAKESRQKLLRRRAPQAGSRTCKYPEAEEALFAEVRVSNDVTWPNSSTLICYIRQRPCS
jgi:hypothetical protein